MFKNPAPTVDVIIEKAGKIVLVKRKNEPFKGMLALPGGFVEYGETVEQAAMRETLEETGLKVELKEILGVYSDPKRDPTKHTLAAVFIAKEVGGKLEADDDAEEVEWFDLNEIDFDILAFDHGKMIKDYIKWKKSGGTFWTKR